MDIVSQRTRPWVVCLNTGTMCAHLSSISPQALSLLVSRLCNFEALITTFNLNMYSNCCPVMLPTLLQHTCECFACALQPCPQPSADSLCTGVAKENYLIFENVMIVLDVCVPTDIITTYSVIVPRPRKLLVPSTQKTQVRVMPSACALSRTALLGLIGY